jgi:lysozyme family protein
MNAKRLEMLKEKAVYSVLMVVAEDYTLDVLREKTEQICKDTFPNADEIMLRVFGDFAHFAQHFFFYHKQVGAEVKRWNKEHGKQAIPLNS